VGVEENEEQEAREHRRFQVGAFCMHCGTKRRVGAAYCIDCGARLPQLEDFASRSDAKLQVEVSCPSCGGGLRLTLPLADRRFRCPKCESWFRAVIGTELLPDETDLLPYHELLGTAPSSTNEEMRRTYRERIAQYHSDKVASLGVELRSGH
jgi:DNA-directed RNA polymerase subunit RPC12/RpoP